MQSRLPALCLYVSGLGLSATSLAARVIAVASGNMEFQTEPARISADGPVSQTYERSASSGSITARAQASFGRLAVHAESHNDDHSGNVVEGTCTAIFEDALTIDAPGRAGEPGTMTFKLNVDGTLTASTRTEGAADPSYARVALSVTGGSAWEGSERRHPGGTKNDVDGQPFLNREVSIAVPFVFGTPMGLSIRLDATS